MGLLTWNENLSVGVAIMDSDHFGLVDIINCFYDEACDGIGKDAVIHALDNLADYAVQHFGHEEALMDEHKYPNSDRHINEHAGFIKKVEELKAEIFPGHQPDTGMVFKFIMDWIPEHLTTEDKELGEFLLSAGVR